MRANLHDNNIIKVTKSQHVLPQSFSVNVPRDTQHLVHNTRKLPLLLVLSMIAETAVKWYNWDPSEGIY